MLGNNTQVTIMDKGNVGNLTKQGKKKAIPNVYFVKGIKHNLMRIAQLLQKRL